MYSSPDSHSRTWVDQMVGGNDRKVHFFENAKTFTISGVQSSTLKIKFWQKYKNCIASDQSYFTNIKPFRSAL